MKPTIIIGIDPGANTGLAVWNCNTKTLDIVRTMHIHTALAAVERLSINGPCVVYVEDARKRKWFGNSGREQLQGAGSIKRDCTIWDDFLADLKGSGTLIDYHLIAPKNISTKLNAATFKSITGYTKQTNEHGRDAAMLVFNKNA